MSQNDPQRGGGKRGNDGPPDLDELFRNVGRKLSELPNGGKGFGSGRNIKNSFLAILGVLAALWLSTGFYIVDAREQGVVLRFGQYVQTTDAGLQWHIPYPFERVEVVNLTEVRIVEVGYRGNAKNRVSEESLMLTSDLNIIDVQLSVQYDVVDPKAFLFSNACADKDCKDIVKQVAESAIRDVVGNNKVDFVLNEGRTHIAADTQALIQKMLNKYQLGIHVGKVNINDVQPPEQVLAAFDDAVKAGQDKDKLRNEGLSYANDVIPKAHGFAARLEAEAEAYKQRVVVNAEGEAQRFKDVVAEYQKAPAVMRDRLYFDMMQQVMNSASKVVVDQKGNNSLLYLPLDKLMHDPAVASTVAPPSGVESTTPSSTSAPVTATTAAPADAARSSGREVRRTRDLEGRP